MIDPLPHSAEEARQLGLKRFQGGYCNRCHRVTVRRIRGGKRGAECVNCLRIKRRNRRFQNN